MDYIILAVSGLTVLVGIIMIFAFIASKNAVIDIVTSFETQNSNSYEIRLKVFNRAINYLSNLEEKSIDENTKKKELGEVFDNLLMVSTRKETLSSFEDVVQTYFKNDVLDLKKFLKFKACARREFGAKKYSAKSVYKYSIPSGKMGFGIFDDRPQMPPPPRPEGMPNGARVNMPPKAPVQNGNAVNTGATFVTTKSQNENMAVPPMNQAKPPVPPVQNGMPNGMPNGMANPNMPPRPMPNGMPNGNIPPRPMPNGMPNGNMPPRPDQPKDNMTANNIIMPKINNDNNKK